jgi:phosphopantetheine adenylyltransferase
MTTDLTRKAMILRVNISQWTGKRFDKKVSARVEAEYNATEAGNYVKSLVAQEAIKKITSISGDARSYVYDQTIRYGDSGDYLLTTRNFEAVNARLQTYCTQFNEAVENFCANYPALIEEARGRLNDMFNTADYPDPAVIRSKFSFRFSFHPLESGDHFIVDLAQEHVDSIRQAIAEGQSQLQKAIDAELWERMRKVVSAMVDKLTPQDAIFRDSLVINVRELCETLKALNVHDDTEIEAIRTRIETQLASADPEALRKDRNVRTGTAIEASNILRAIEDGSRRVKL